MRDTVIGIAVLTQEPDKMKLQALCVLSILTAVLAIPVQTQVEKRQIAGLLNELLGDDIKL